MPRIFSQVQEKIKYWSFQRTKSILAFFFLVLLVGSHFLPLAQAATSPWTQTDWSGGVGTSTTNQYSAASNVTTSTANQVTLTPTEKLTNTGFETDLSSWSTNGTMNDTNFTGTSGAVTAWPFDDMVTTQSYARVLNPAMSPGRNIVINDTLATDTIWTKGTGWTIAGGVGHSDGTGTSAAISQTLPIVPGKSYSVVFTVSNFVSGTIRAQVGTANGTNRTANGTFTETIVAAGNTTFGLQTNTAFVGDIDNVSVTQLNILASSSFTMPELLTDGNMESALTSSWAVVNAAGLTKQTPVDPHGGTRVLRVTRTTTTNASAGQTVMTVGKTYRIQGYVRSDGSALPIVRDNGTAIFTGTNSTSYQFFDIIRIAAATQIQFGTSTINTGEYVEFDDVSVTEVDPLIARPGNGVVRGTATGANGHLATAYTFDGVDDEVNLYSADLNSVFNQSEGTAIVWAKVSSAAVWTDGASHYITLYRADVNNKVELFKTTTNNQLTIRYVANNVVSGANFTASPTDWFQTAITWSKTSDQVKVYFNGAQQGSTATGLGTWVGNLNSGTTVAGASSNAGLLPWSGMINDVRLYNRALSASEVLALYTGTVTTRDTTTTYLGSAGSAKLVVAADQQALFTQSVNVGDTNSYNLVAFARTDGSAVTSGDLSLYVNGANISTTYTSVGSGWYKLSGTVTGVASAVDYGVQIVSGKTVYLDNFSLNNYPSPGTLTSSIFDTGQGSNWGILTYAATTPTNTTVAVKVRTSNDPLMVGATAFASCTAIASGVDISANSCVTDGQRYVQYQITESTSDLLNTPTFTSFSLPFTQSDVSPPTGGSITYTDGYYTATSVALTVNDGTDTGSGIDTSSRIIQRKFATLTSGTCGTYGLFATITPTGSYPNYTDTTVSSGFCYQYQYQVSDLATSPNQATYVGTSTAKIDTGLPTTPGNPTTTSPTNSTSQSWNWTAATDALSNIASYLWRTTGTAVVSGSTPVNSVVTNLAEGIYTFFVKAVDGAGNQGAESSGTVTVDTTSPTTPGTPSTTTPTNNTTPTWTWTASTDSGTGLASPAYTVEWSQSATFSGGVSSSTAATATFTHTIPLAQGTWYFRVRATDAVGDVSANSPNGTVVIGTASAPSDTTAPTSLELRNPGENSYINQERPSFQWRTASDTGSGMGKYILSVHNADNTGFTIDNIPVSGTTDFITNKYVVRFENFSDSDQTNNYISVQTRSSAEWGPTENDGKLVEGRVSYTVTAVDNAGNTQSLGRPFFFDKTSPTAQFTQINTVPFNTNSFSTTDTTPTMYGRLTDPLAGAIASGPNEVDIKIEKKVGVLYQLVSLTTQHMDVPWYTCDDSKVTDNTQQRCDKYLPFEFTPQMPLDLGDYKITLTGKDKADNTSPEVLLFLHVKASGQIAARPPASAPNATEVPNETLPAPSSQPTSGPEEITVPEAPVGPSGISKAVQGGGNLLSSIIGGIFRGIKTVFGAVGSTIAFIGRGIGNVGSTIARVFGNTYNTLAQGAPGILRTMMLALGNACGSTRMYIASLLHNIGHGIQTGATNLAFVVGEKTQDVSSGIGMGIIEFTYNFVPEPTTISNVKVARATATSMTITWTTNHPATTKVNYGLTPDYGQDVQSQKRVTNHEVTVTGLQPNTPYSYEVMSQNRNYVYDANHIFVTPAE
ncbi:MAG: LamG-like jellyroll fold domain-containing protein [Candidatus Woesebacteria bacterium]